MAKPAVVVVVWKRLVLQAWRSAKAASLIVCRRVGSTSPQARSVSRCRRRSRKVHAKAGQRFVAAPVFGRPTSQP